MAPLRIATLDDDQIQTVVDEGVRYDQFGIDTLERLRAGCPPIATINDCYRAMRVIDEIYEKAIHV